MASGPPCRRPRCRSRSGPSRRRRSVWAFLVGKTATNCHHAAVWTPGTSSGQRVSLQAPCWLPWDALTEVELPACVLVGGYAESTAATGRRVRAGVGVPDRADLGRSACVASSAARRLDYHLGVTVTSCSSTTARASCVSVLEGRGATGGVAVDEPLRDVERALTGCCRCGSWNALIGDPRAGRCCRARPAGKRRSALPVCARWRRGRRARRQGGPRRLALRRARGVRHRTGDSRLSRPAPAATGSSTPTAASRCRRRHRGSS